MSRPFLGGSTIIAVGVTRFSCNIFSNTFSTSPAKNSILSILFSLAFSFASSIASSTISIPYTFFTNLEANIPIVPIPQYKSQSTSSLLKFANSIALLYSNSV